MNKIFGINPVKELITTNHENISALFISNRKNSRIDEIINISKKININIKYINSDEIEKILPECNHQGIYAITKKNINPTVSEDEILNSEKRCSTILILDGITDPHNLGAILRSCDIFGVDALVLPKDNSAQVNETVFKTSSGAVMYVPVCTVVNIVRFIEKLKEKDYWVYITDKENGISPRAENFAPKSAIVIGSEGKGIRKLIKEKGDIVLTIPSAGHVDSLNASNACAILLYEIYCQKNK